MSPQTPVAEWVQAGLECQVLVNPFYGLNGYVHLPEAVRGLKLGCDEGSLRQIKVHGGLTYMNDGWVGFDTLHAGDVWPIEVINEYRARNGLPPIIEGSLDDQYRISRNYRDEWTTDWTLEKVTYEVSSLADQIAAITCWHEAESKAGTDECAHCLLWESLAMARKELTDAANDVKNLKLAFGLAGQDTLLNGISQAIDAAVENLRRRAETFKLNQFSLAYGGKVIIDSISTVEAYKKVESKIDSRARAVAEEIKDR